jgi:hypothetical protein
MKGRFLVIVALAGIVSGCGAGSVPGSEKLNSHIDEYISIPGLNKPLDSYFFEVQYPIRPPADGYMAGKIVAVDPQSKKLDDQLQRALPADLLAVEPDEVGTIVWAKWGEAHVGTYHAENGVTHKGEAYQGYCTVVVIDKEARLIVGGRAFQAPAPPETTTENGDIHTQVDVAEVVAYLKSLPTTPPPSLAPTLTS